LTTTVSIAPALQERRMGTMGRIHASPKGYAGHGGNYVAPAVPRKKQFSKKARNNNSRKIARLSFSARLKRVT
jgi:hypothetical protein